MKRSHSAFVHEAKRICVDHIQGAKRSFDVAFEMHEHAIMNSEANTHEPSYRPAKRMTLEASQNYMCSDNNPYHRSHSDDGSGSPEQNAHRNIDGAHFTSGVSAYEYARIFREGYAAGSYNSRKHAHEHFSDIESKLPRLIREHYESHINHLATIFDAELKNTIAQMMQNTTRYDWVH